jgi:hypothetical protein
MGGHELFEIAAAAPLTVDGCRFGKNQDLGHMPAIGAQEFEKWHTFPLYIVSVQKQDNLFAFKEGKIFNRRNTLRILRIEN